MLEILIVITITVLLAVIGYTLSSGFILQSHVRAAAGILDAEAHQAQIDAYFQLDDAAQGVKLFTDRVVRFEGSTYATRTTSKDVTTYFPSSVTISSTTEITFPNGSIKPTTSTTLTVSNAQTAYDLLVSTYGILSLTSRSVAP